MQQNIHFFFFYQKSIKYPMKYHISCELKILPEIVGNL